MRVSSSVAAAAAAASPSPSAGGPGRPAALLRGRRAATGRRGGRSGARREGTPRRRAADGFERGGEAASAASPRGAPARSAAAGVAPPAPGRRAAFFDVDGTITKSNVVVPFFMMRIRALPRWLRAPYTLVFLARAAMYMLIDWVSRSAFNRVFYASYRGQDVLETGAFLSSHVWREYMLPNVFPAAVAELRRLKRLGFAIVLVTGSLDLVVRPLAEHVGADHVIAAALEEGEVGPGGGRRFTGRLADEPLAGEAKARRIRALSEEQGLDLAGSVAYGDSKADLAMLRCVGAGHAVRPDATLARVAREEGWEVHDWDRSGSAVSVADVFREGFSAA